MTDYVRVEITQDMPFEFRGTDLEVYGNYEEGDIVELPKDNAEILVNRHNAEFAESDKQ